MTTTQGLQKLYTTITGRSARNSKGNILSDLADNWSASTAPAVATTSKAGVVKQGVAVSDAASTAPTATEFKALLDSLRDAGVIAES